MIYRHLFCASLVLSLGFAALEFSPPASARAGIACSTPITGAPSGPATVSTASTAYGQVLVVGSAEYSGCSLYLLTSDRLDPLTTGAEPFACSDDANILKHPCDTLLWPAPAHRRCTDCRPRRRSRAARDGLPHRRAAGYDG